jgi:hypothetical protein
VNVDVSFLRERLPQPSHQPGSVADMADVPPEFIPGLGFFPGGSGTWAAPGRPAPTLLPDSACMFVGQDFGRESDFKFALEQKEENRGIDTWKKLIDTLDLAGLGTEQRRSCFFTNSVMGLRTTKKIEGRSLRLRHRGFRSACVEFLKLQISTLRPRAVIALGREPLGLLASAVSAARRPYRCSFQEIDSRGLAVQEASLDNDDHRFMLGILMHPVARPYQVERRRIDVHAGKHAQAEIVRRCWTFRP